MGIFLTLNNNLTTVELYARNTSRRTSINVHFQVYIGLCRYEDQCLQMEFCIADGLNIYRINKKPECMYTGDTHVLGDKGAKRLKG